MGMRKDFIPRHLIQFPEVFRVNELLVLLREFWGYYHLFRLRCVKEPGFRDEDSLKRCTLFTQCRLFDVIIFNLINLGSDVLSLLVKGSKLVFSKIWLFKFYLD